MDGDTQRTHSPPEARDNAGQKASRRPWSGLHSSRIRYRFKVQVFDFMLQWILGAQTNGATKVGESFFAATNIRDGDPAR